MVCRWIDDTKHQMRRWIRRWEMTPSASLFSCVVLVHVLRRTTWNRYECHLRRFPLGGIFFCVNGFVVETKHILVCMTSCLQHTNLFVIILSLSLSLSLSYLLWLSFVFHGCFFLFGVFRFSKSIERNADPQEEICGIYEILQLYSS